MDAQNADLSALRIDRSAGSEPPSFPWGKAALWVVVLAVVLVAAYVGWRALIAPAPEVRLVTASLSSPSQQNAVLTASGYVVAQRKASVASKGTGRLVYLGVVEGDRVKTDQVIARLEDNDIRAQQAQARANLRLNEAELNDAEQSLSRTRSLFAKSLTSQAELDAAEARFERVRAAIDVARAALAVADVALENTLIRAPFDGTVLTKNADVGEIVAPLAASASSRAAVVTIADMNSLEVEADVSEANIQRISPGQPAEITLDAYPSKRYRGFVSKVVPTADRAKATVMVKVGFASYDDAVLPEMSAKVLFLTEPLRSDQLDQKPVLTLPASAVLSEDGRAAVYTVEEGRARRTAVTTGRSMGSLVEITAGLTAGTKVIDQPPGDLRDGSAVTIR